MKRVLLTALGLACSPAARPWPDAGVRVVAERRSTGDEELSAWLVVSVEGQPNPPAVPPPAASGTATELPPAREPGADGAPAQGAEGGDEPSLPWPPSPELVAFARGADPLSLSPAFVRRVLDAVTGAADVPLDGAGWIRRSRRAAALPELRLRVGQSTDRSLRVGSDSSPDVSVTETGGADLYFEGQVTWRLSGLGWSGEEPRIEQLRRAEARELRQLREQALAALLAWYEATRALSDEALSPSERARAELEELTARLELDELTGGWFGEVGLGQAASAQAPGIERSLETERTRSPAPDAAAPAAGLRAASLARGPILR